jgi:hypothetical protein
VIWRDRKEKTKAAFTFGGELQIEPDETHTTCVTTSSAPILRVVRRFSLSTMLAVEIEVLLAERRAAWVHDLGAFEKRLAAAEPPVLYRACLEALKEKFQKLVFEAPVEPLRRFGRFLDTETQRLHKAWDRSLHVPALGELL